MRTQTFTGSTSREVLDKVKQALGDDALILSNRTHDGGIEIVALAATELGSASAALAPASPARRREIEAPRAPLAPASAAFAPVSAAFAPVSAALAPVSYPPAPAAAAAQYASLAEELYCAPEPAAAPAPGYTSAPVQHFQRLERPAPAAVMPSPPAAALHPTADMDGILSEIQSLKNVLRNEIAAFTSADTNTAGSPNFGRPSILRELLDAGFSAQLARRLAGDPSVPQTQASSMEQVATRLQDAVKVADADEIINQGGVYALVGPTGVGKTTTVAKLAARAVVRFGASRVALLTTDSYRIGAHDQLKIYGRILSVPVHAIRDADDLAATLEQLSGKHLVLIDTIGMSQRDRMLAEQAKVLSASCKVKRILLVSTTANAATLNQVVSIYKGSGVEGCILTKTDEAASLTPAIDAVVRHGLPVHYVTDGQRVPEDLQLPDLASLVLEALNPPSDPAFDIGTDELPLAAHPAPVGSPAPAAPVLPASSVPVFPYSAAPAVPVLPVMHAMPVCEPQARVVHG